MNRIKLLAVAAMTALFAVGIASARPSLPEGPVSFKLTAMQQMPNVVASKTNTTSGATNITTTTKYIITSTSIVNNDILQLLANSFTNLPASITSEQLMTDGGGAFFVVTPTTTNYVGNVLRISITSTVISGTQTTVNKNPPGTFSFTESATFTQVATLTYDDSALTTRDGSNTSITLHGLLVTKFKDPNSTSTSKFTLTGSGDGNIQGASTVIKGVVTGSTSTGN
ncbi:MAG TPA: hypothetical protein VGI88_00840 [Verrucomicrobiae bacterium]|jgi:hypothetical protein